MVVCSRCGEEASDVIQCSVCHLQFDFPCSGISEKGYRKLGDRQATWRCSTCKSGGQLTASTTSSMTTSPVTLDSIMRELANINFKLAPLSSLASEVQLLRKEICDLKSTVSEYPAKIQSLEEKMAKFEIVQMDVMDIKKAFSTLEEEQRATDQWLRSNNVEIKGVPLRDRENLFDIATKIGEQVSFPVDKNRINFIHRVPTNISGVKNIILSFTNKYLKEDFISAARLRKEPLTSKDIGLAGTQRIYVNDHLTSKNKNLLSKCKALAKEHNFQYVWVKHMKIFVRKDQMSKSFIITSEQDLTRIR